MATYDENGKKIDGRRFNKITPEMEERKYKPGQTGNPLGRPAGGKPSKSKVLSKLNQIWMRSEAPEQWFVAGLEYLSRKNGNDISLNIAELIAARIAYCLATNTKYQNPALLKEYIDRAEGKVPLIVRSKDYGGDDDFDALTDEELEAYLEDIDRRALLAHKQAEQEQQQKQLEEKEPDAPATEVAGHDEIN
jgi:hypothetical protein